LLDKVDIRLTEGWIKIQADTNGMTEIQYSQLTNLTLVRLVGLTA